MPSSDYTSAVGGGLKLKGAAQDAGVKKTKKKKKPFKTEGEPEVPQSTDGSVSLQRALAEEEKNGEKDNEVTALERAAETRELGKTEAQKRHEERRRKRVCSPVQLHTSTSTFPSLVSRLPLDPQGLTGFGAQLDDRLKREGLKTHKERVEELNKYLSGLSEHHDMPRIGPG